MIRNSSVTAMAGLLLLLGAVDGHAEKWVKNNVDVPNKNLKANYYDASSVRAQGNAIAWTEKFVLTDFGSKAYTKHLKQYPDCAKNIGANDSVTYHQLDFEIKDGNYRTVAKRNYNKAGKIVCTDREMGKEFDRDWHDIEYKSPMYERHYIFVTKFNMGNR